MTCYRLVIDSLEACLRVILQQTQNKAPSTLVLLTLLCSLLRDLHFKTTTDQTPTVVNASSSRIV